MGSFATHRGMEVKGAQLLHQSTTSSLSTTERMAAAREAQQNNLFGGMLKDRDKAIAQLAQRISTNMDGEAKQMLRAFCAKGDPAAAAEGMIAGLSTPGVKTGTARTMIDYYRDTLNAKAVETARAEPTSAARKTTEKALKGEVELLVRDLGRKALSQMAANGVPMNSKQFEEVRKQTGLTALEASEAVVRTPIKPATDPSPYSALEGRLSAIARNIMSPDLSTGEKLARNGMLANKLTDLVPATERKRANVDERDVRHVLHKTEIQAMNFNLQKVKEQCQAADMNPVERARAVLKLEHENRQLVSASTSVELRQLYAQETQPQMKLLAIQAIRGLMEDTSGKNGTLKDELKLVRELQDHYNIRRNEAAQLAAGSAAVLLEGARQAIEKSSGQLTLAAAEQTQRAKQLIEQFKVGRNPVLADQLRELAVH